MSTTPAARMARLKVTYPDWMFARDGAGGGCAWHKTILGLSVTAADLGSLENQIRGAVNPEGYAAAALSRARAAGARVP